MRDHWSLDPDLVYLNHGSFGAVPRVTREAQQRLQATAEANPMQWFRSLPERLAITRERIGGYLGVGGDDIAFVPNASNGVNIALRSLRGGEGGRLILTSHSYGAVLLAARRIVAERGWDLEVVDLPLDAADADIATAIETALDRPAVGIVVDQITSATAKMLPLHPIIEIGRRHGVPVIVDGAHAPGLLDRPVCGDFWTGNLHKWPCAPRGTGILWVAPDRRDEVVPAVVSWSDALGFPVSFDVPGTTDSTGWLAATASLDLLDDLGFGAARPALGDLVAAGSETFADAFGTRVLDAGSPAPTMRLVELPPGVDIADDVAGNRLQAAAAAATGVETALTNWRGRAFLRLSAHLYNRIEDYEIGAARLAAFFDDARQRGGQLHD